MPKRITKRTVSKRPAAKAAAKAPAAVPGNWLKTAYDMAKPGLMLLAVALAWFGQDQFFNRHPTPGLWLWLGAAIAAVAAFWRQPNRLPETLPFKVEIGVLGVIALVALVFRTWNLAGQPNGYFFDEAMHGLGGIDILKGAVPIFGPPDAPHPTLFFYLNALAMKIGGISIAGTRLAPAFLGTATVVMFYFLARRIVSAPVALAGAFVLAVMRWHVNFSRINFEIIGTPMFATAAVYFMLRGLETKNRWAMGLSECMTG